MSDRIHHLQKYVRTSCGLWHNLHTYFINGGIAKCQIARSHCDGYKKKQQNTPQRFANLHDMCSVQCQTRDKNAATQAILRSAQEKTKV
jgi:hypothetical protein